jgi:hypothetical protein
VEVEAAGVADFNTIIEVLGSYTRIHARPGRNQDSREIFVPMKHVCCGYEIARFVNLHIL